MINKSVSRSGLSSAMLSRIKHWQKTIASFYRANLALCFVVIIAFFSWLIFINQQGFLNLWLTRDQQAMIALKQGDAGKAAHTFIDKNWLAYSFYANGDYQQAASLFAQLPGISNRFAQANALAHAGQYFSAADLYQEIIKLQASHQQAIENLALMNKIIKKMKKSPGKKTLSTKLANQQQFNKVKKEPAKTQRLPSHALWLEQVQQNPAKFLRKKFQQEHVNEQQ